MPYEWEEWAMLGLVGIDPYEVRQVLEARHRWPRSGTGPGGVRLLTIWGRTLVDRPLIVALYHDGCLTWKIVGARDLTEAELAQFSRWEETR